MAPPLTGGGAVDRQGATRVTQALPRKVFPRPRSLVDAASRGRPSTHDSKRRLDRDPLEMRYGPRLQVPTKRDADKPFITARLGEFPELTSVRLLYEIRAAVYTGGITQPQEFVRRVRPQPPVQEVVRLGTPPAHQTQVLGHRAGSASTGRPPRRKRGGFALLRPTGASGHGAAGPIEPRPREGRAAHSLRPDQLRL